MASPGGTRSSRRFCAAQPPPEELGGYQARPALLLRYVSLIPFLDDAALGAKLDVWNTSHSFLELGAGAAAPTPRHPRFVPPP